MQLSYSKPWHSGIYMISIQVMKLMIKLLPLLGLRLASRAINQLNKQIVVTILNICRHCNKVFHTFVATPSFVQGHIACSKAVGLATHDQHTSYNPYLRSCIHSY